ncbi:hypothetical protein [Chitinilyticum litopenaei]|uniref:hypothetical protein n=1 Tax=Chitinilyticum litopenaei TaxID=1121276 RepID=UPI000401C555|nr:hypothetical protein [Chitinilyticum litopenaei]
MDDIIFHENYETVVCRFNTKGIIQFAASRLDGFIKHHHLIKEHKCDRLLIQFSELDQALELLDKYEYTNQITEINFYPAGHVTEPIAVSEAFLLKFKNLQSMQFSEGVTYKGVDFHKFDQLTELRLVCDQKNMSWVGHPSIQKLLLFKLKEKSLDFVRGMNIVNLHLAECAMTSLSGIEYLENLESLRIEKARNLIDLSPIIKCKKLNRIRIFGYKKVTDWRFLAEKENWIEISLDTIDTFEYLLKLKDLKSLHASKVLDKNESALESNPKIMAEFKRKRELTVEQRGAEQIW